jgi:galactokinase/mevalonate kinase-like predicted kinase
MIQKIISLPPDMVEHFCDVARVSPTEYFATSDPRGARLGSGGGTVWALDEARRAGMLGKGDKCIVLHAGGQSRRLPAYAPEGKLLTPIPVMRWARGERLSQTLLSRQMPLYEKMLEHAPDRLTTLIASGDVYIHCSKPLAPVPDADVVLYGLWDENRAARNHGVFALRRDGRGELDRMLQKPDDATLAAIEQTHFYLLDIGVWLLSDRAVALLEKRSRERAADDDPTDVGNYDLYSEFGYALGVHAPMHDAEIAELTVKVVPLDGGGFYHYGTSRELITSTLRLQNLVADQRAILHHNSKPHPAMFVQNADIRIPLRPDNSTLWVENACIGPRWSLTSGHVVTGTPDNDWGLRLTPGQCIDVVPVGDRLFAARPYGIDDKFKGALTDLDTLYCGKPFAEWAAERDIDIEQFFDDPAELADLQAARIFPVAEDVDDLGLILRFMTSEPELEVGRDLWLHSVRFSANQLMEYACVERIESQREELRARAVEMLAANHAKSVFYQSDLAETAALYAARDLPLPAELPAATPALTRISDAMFRSRVSSLRADEASAARWSDEAFALLSRSMIEGLEGEKCLPRLATHLDQIVWARSPVRIDLAGGWTDTPPYCLLEGGAVVNLAIELNGQPPLQVYIKPSKTFAVTLRSIDLGAQEVLTTFDELRRFNRIGSPFSIPKAALALAGFLPEFCKERFASLEEQLRSFGCGIELTLLAAIPAGSGLGTSSILGGTVLGAINEFCGLAWSRQEVCNRTLILEQLLTSGGGWQDQYGGILPGLKLLTTQRGEAQRPDTRWASDVLFTDAQYRELHLLYYTGITRTAKNILGEIVKNMFLNSAPHFELLREMKQHAFDLFEAMQRNDFDAYGRLVATTWRQNQLLDSGTNPPEVANLLAQVGDLCSGCKLPGAGGGGYLYMVAKDLDAAARIKQQLTSNPINGNARFVELSVSRKGLEVSCS